jgi:hypothetical protein
LAKAEQWALYSTPSAHRPHAPIAACRLAIMCVNTVRMSRRIEASRSASYTDRAPHTSTSLSTAQGNRVNLRYLVTRLARNSSSQPAVLRLSRREAFPGASRIRFWAMCLMVQKLAGA